MKDFNNIKFIRWGGLNPVKHKEGRLSTDDERRFYHTAPCFKGIYAFPEGLIEPFLLGGAKVNDNKTQGRYLFLKDENGNRISTLDFYDDYSFEIRPKYIKLLKSKGIKEKNISSEIDEEEYNKDEENPIWYVTYLTNKHTFEYKGPIWHHLKAKKEEIIKEKGSWTLSTYKDYVNILKRSICNDKFDTYLLYKKYHGKISGSPHSCPLTGVKDHYEVFIERLK